MNQCIGCGGMNHEALFRGLLKCQNCGHVTMDLCFSEAELCGLYNQEYFLGGEYLNYIAEKQALQKNFKLRLKVLQQFLDPLRHKHLFEIGCAYGFFLDIARDYFETLEGIDIVHEGIHYAREHLRLNVVQGDFLKYDFEGTQFDIVCLWDTIEHLHSPHLYLEKVANHMTRGGLVAITTGDIESPNARLRKEKWRLIHPPTHVHYFSRRTLTKMLSNYGFDVIYGRYCGFHRSIDSILYSILVLRNRKFRLYRFLHKLRVTSFSPYLNLYDIMYLIACKR